MPKLTANHIYLLKELEELKARYISLIKPYEQYYERWSKKPSEDPIDWDLIGSMHATSAALQGIKYSVSLVVSAYLEAMINFHLSLNMTSKQFNAIDNVQMENKWSVILAYVESGYAFPTAGNIEEGLKTLKKARNAITHMKPKIEDGEVVIHKGQNPDEITFGHQDKKLIDLWFRLPHLIIDDMEKQLGELKIRSMKLFSGLSDTRLNSKYLQIIPE